MLLLSAFEQGLTTLTATAVQLITTTSTSKGYMMSTGMVSLHHTSTSAFALNSTTRPFPGCAEALPAAARPAVTCPVVLCQAQAKSVVLLLAG